MQHRFEYEQHEQTKQQVTSLVVVGQLSGFTAMAKTVGYPLGIAAKLILEDKISQRGLLIPVHQEIYQPILDTLATLGICFVESEAMPTADSTPQKE